MKKNKTTKKNVAKKKALATGARSGHASKRRVGANLVIAGAGAQESSLSSDPQAAASLQAIMEFLSRELGDNQTERLLETTAEILKRVKEQTLMISALRKRL